MWEYLGVEVPDDTRGVLQDTHWASGSIGYFPTYALGNLISAQLWERVLGRPARTSTRSSSGASSAPLREWLREHLHRHGRKFTPTETLERAIGTNADRPRAVRALPARASSATIYGLPAGVGLSPTREPVRVRDRRRAAD